jgi:hypothetical protein
MVVPVIVVVAAVVVIIVPMMPVVAIVRPLHEAARDAGVAHRH